MGIVAKAADVERTHLCVQGVLDQVHGTSSPHCQPLGVGDLAVGGNPDKLVGHRDLVKKAVLAVGEVGVGHPDLGQEGPVQGQLGHATRGIVAQAVTTFIKRLEQNLNKYLSTEDQPRIV